MTKDKNRRQRFIAGLIQISLGKNAEDNLKETIFWIDNQAKNGANVVCLP